MDSLFCGGKIMDEKIEKMDQRTAAHEMVVRALGTAAKEAIANVKDNASVIGICQAVANAYRQEEERFWGE
jgi:hypothetical protein